MKKIFLALFAAALLLCISSCVECDGKGENQTPVRSAVENPKKSKTVTILNWNLQTFFDGVNDGNEYSEFKKSKAWNLDCYVERLEKLCSVIKECDADIVVMEELEKKEQLADITNTLSGTFDFASVYSYGAFSKNEDSSIGCGILSRYQIEDFSVHNIDYRIENITQPSMRPIAEVTIFTGKSSPRFKIFINHWKSKSSGEAESEIWRDRQENLLAVKMKRATEQGIVAVACGDFNRELMEFSIEDGKIALGDEKFICKNPWIEEDGAIKTEGSYRYNGKWEKIDHFFLAGNFEVKTFEVKNKGAWATEEGFPKKYEIWTGDGYSDHLPIYLELAIN